MMRSGGTPNFSSTPALSIRLSFIVSSRLIWPLTSWAMSLSPVTITTS